MFSFLGKIFLLIRRFKNYYIKKYQKTKLYFCGKDVYIGDNCTFTYENVLIGNKTSIGKNCVIQSKHGKIIIGENVMLGPGVNIHGGDHPIHEIGKKLYECSKEGCYDGEVIIENDCWIGANAIILKKVKIGTGSIVGAGSIVTKDIPPYSVYVGSHSSKIYQRFNDDDLMKHINFLKEREM